MKTSIYAQIEENKSKSIMMIVFFVLFILMLSFIFQKAIGGGNGIIVFGLFFSLISSAVSYYYGDKMMLGMSGAVEADREKDFYLYTAVENMAIAAGIPKPKVYVIEDSAPNAFASGRDPDHAVICATRGIINKLEKSELEAVIAHEMSHIKNYDIRIMVIVGVLVGTVAFMADWFGRTLWWGGNDRDNKSSGTIFLILGLLLAIISPLAATIIQLAVSRKREFLADASGALLNRNPKALAFALQKISNDREVLEAATNATAHLYIINPFKDKNFGAWFSGLFNTHPPVEERIKILLSM